MALSDNLVAYYSLADINDATGRGNTLTNTNAVTFVSGKVGNAANFVVASTQYLTRASTADLQTGAIDFTVAGWVNLASKTTFRMLACKYSPGLAEWLLYYNPGGSDRFAFQTYVLASEASLGNVIATSFGSPSTGVWYFVCVQQIAAGPQLRISVNDGTVNTVTPTGTPTAGSGNFQIGAYRNGALTHDGLIDELGIWKKALTAGEITQLYNAGSGMSYADIVADGATGQPMALRQSLFNKPPFGRGIA